MKKRGNATLIGAFVVVGLVLVLTGVIVAGGGKLFGRKEHIVMNFSGSIYGLQIGAPVVFRGVRVGSVRSVGLLYDDGSRDYLIPVWADLEPRSLKGLAENGDDGMAALTSLVGRGLTAQLSIQSLLTGQLYIDLDLRPQRQAVRSSSTNDDALEVPTSATTIQNLTKQLDDIDIRRLLDDVSSIAKSARTVLAGPQLKHSLDNLEAITANLRNVSDRLDKRFDPLVESASATLRDARTAANNVAATADRLGGTADRINALVAPDSELVRKVQRTADELSAMAASLRTQTSEDSELMQNAEQALHDVSRAARSLRELAELLDRQPESLLRGKRSTEDKP